MIWRWLSHWLHRRHATSPSDQYERVEPHWELYRDVYWVPIRGLDMDRFSEDEARAYWLDQLPRRWRGREEIDP